MDGFSVEQFGTLLANAGVAGTLAIWFSWKQAKSEENCRADLKQVNESIQQRLSTTIQENTTAVTRQSAISERTNVLLDRLDERLASRD